MFINELINQLNNLGFCSTLYYPVLNGHNKFTITTFYMNMWWVMIKAIYIKQNTLYDKY